jgi:hypothetical protein
MGKKKAGGISVGRLPPLAAEQLRDKGKWTQKSRDIFSDRGFCQTAIVTRLHLPLRLETLSYL